MTFNNTDLYCQVLGSIMKEPSVLSSLPMPIAIDDFSQENQIARVIYFSLSNLIDTTFLYLFVKWTFSSKYSDSSKNSQYLS